LSWQSENFAFGIDIHHRRKKMDNQTKLSRNRISILILLAVFSLVILSSHTLAQSKLPRGTFVGGDWAITIGSKNQFRVREKGKVVVVGTYTVTGDQIAFSNERGIRACTEAGMEVGKYKWAYDGKDLTLTKIEDNCEGRVNALATQSLVKQKM